MATMNLKKSNLTYPHLLWGAGNKGGITMMSPFETWTFLLALVLCIGYGYYLCECKHRWDRSRKYMSIKGIGSRKYDNFWR